MFYKMIIKNFNNYYNNNILHIIQTLNASCKASRSLMFKRLSNFTSTTLLK